MSCSTQTTTSGPCVKCVHPFEYIFELAYQGLSGVNNTLVFEEILDAILDKGIVTTNCGMCCPSCEGIYSLASVETMLNLYEALGLTVSAAVPASPLLTSTNNNYINNDLPCCSNVYASLETWLKYAEAVGLSASAAVPASPYGLNASFTPSYSSDEFITCCNGFNECVDDLICWASAGRSTAEIVDLILDEGLIEYGGIYNNCTKTDNDNICKFLELLNKYLGNTLNINRRANVLNRLLDKGITISCSENGEMIIASVETWLKYGEAVGLTQSAAVPALGETTTTTTIQ
jgi:hypothetical protein